MLNESLVIAQSYRAGEPWGVARDRLLREGTSALPKLASQTRALREVYDRIGQLTEAERLWMLEEADRAGQQAMLWLAICRTYHFIREFAVEVIVDRFTSWRLELGLDAFDRFFAGKAELDQSLTELLPSTCAKLRQVLFRILRESGLLSHSGQIEAVWLPLRMKQLIEEHSPEDLRVFPGGEGAR